MYASQLKSGGGGVESSVFACADATSGIIKLIDIAKVAKRNKFIGFLLVLSVIQLLKRLYRYPAEQSSIGNTFT